MPKYLDMPGLTYFYNQIKNKFASKTDVSTPSTASTISAMTNTNKVYVYTGSESGHTFGDWYYYEDGAWHSGGQYQANVYETDKTLTIENRPADAKKTGDEITDLKSVLKSQGLDNLLDNLTHLSKTHNNITWTWNGNSCNVVGTASAIENNDFFSSSSSMPSGFEAGTTYYIRYSSSKINLRIYYYPNGGSATEIFNSKSDGEVLIPNDAVGLIIRLNIPSGAVVNETVMPLISKFKTKTSFLYRPIFTLDAGLFEKGGIVNGQDSEYAKAGRIRTPILYALNNIEIKADIASYANARFGLSIYNTDGTFSLDAGWKTKHIIEKGTIFRIVLSYNYTDANTEYSISTIFECFNIITHTDLNSVKTDINALINGEYDHGLFEKGSLASNGIDDDDSFRSNCRVRFKEFYSFNMGIAITANNANTKILASIETNNTVSGTGWQPFISIEPNQRARIVIDCDVNNSSPTLKTIDEVLSNVTISTKIRSLSALYQCISSLDVELFEKGGLEAGVNNTYGQKGRVRTGLLYALNDIHISAKAETYANARTIVFLFDFDGKLLSHSGWKTDCHIEAGKIFKVLLAYNFSDVNTEYSIEQIFNCFSIVSPVNTVSSSIIELTNVSDIKPLFEHGSLESGLNNNYNSGSRARTIDILTCKKDIFVKYNSGVYGVHYFENGIFNKATPWLNYGKVIPANTEFRLVVTQQATSSAYTPISTILNCIEFRIVDNYEYGLNPNILYQARNVDDSEYPPYSKWYIQASAINQYDRVRVNIRKTTDGHYVLIHNSTINSEARNMDGTTISETINSNGQTLSTLNSYDWGIKYGAKYAGYGVPTLEEACEYASMYNLGLTIEVSFWATNEEIDEIAEIINKYGLLQNLIVIAVDSHMWGFSHWVSINDYISVQAAGDIEYLTEHEADINSYKTDKNTVYVGVLPWPSVADDAVRALALKNSWKLYCGMIMNKNDLFNTVGFDKGYSIIEANNLYRIKDTIRDYANATLI